jgi:hypothetical protein
MSILNISQRFEFESLASVGCSIHDALMAGCNLSPKQADKVADDAELMVWWQEARARGAARIMVAMSQAGAEGSSSAAKLALSTHVLAAEREEERMRENRRTGKGKIIDVSKSVALLFEGLILAQEEWPGEDDSPIKLADGRSISRVYYMEHRTNG